MYVARYYEEVVGPDGLTRQVRRSVILGPVAAIGKRKDAQNRLMEILQPINLGQESPKTAVTFSEFVEEHWQVGVLPLFKLSTQIGYGPLLRRYLLPQFGSKLLSEITPPHVQEFLGQLSKTGASWYTVRNLRNLLSRIVRNAVEWGYIHRNPVTGIKLPPRPLPSRRLFLSPAEVRGLIAQLKEPYRSMVLFDVLTGLSRGELFALRWSVIDFERSLLEVREAVYEGNFGTPKTRNRNRRVPLSRAALDLLKFHRVRSIKTGPMDLVFASRHGTPIRPDNVLKRAIHPACDRLKVPRVGWHALRHTHATMLSELGEPVKVAQAILGHADIETTLSVYTHSVPESERRAEEKLANFVLDPNGPKLKKSQKPEPRQAVWIN
jgi:integrase